MEDLYCTVNGVRSRYQTCGEGTPVVLIHGIGASVEYWANNIRPLGEHYRVFAMDLPGFGRSDKVVPELSLPTILRFVDGFLDTHGLEWVDLVGNSMGGLIALQAAIQSPQRVRKLVLVDNAGFGRELHWTFRVMSLPVVGEVMFWAAPWAMDIVVRAMFYDQSKAPDGWRKTMVDLTREPGAMRAHLATLRYGANLLGIKPEIVRQVRDGVSRLAIPTLIVWGHQDRMIPFKQGLTGLDAVAGSQLHIWDKCGHVPQIERADEFNRLVLSFLAGS